MGMGGVTSHAHQLKKYDYPQV